MLLKKQASRLHLRSNVVNVKRNIRTQINLSSTRTLNHVHVLQSPSAIKVMTKTARPECQVLYSKGQCFSFSTQGKDNFSVHLTLVPTASMHSFSTLLEGHVFRSNESFHSPQNSLEYFRDLRHGFCQLSHNLK
jgi:hypothetical protein